MNIFNYFKLIVLSLMFLGCSQGIPSLEQRHATLLNSISQESLVSIPITTQNFTLFSLQSSVTCNDSVMHVYIEGDGLAWKTRSLISDDPTPLTPVALTLMKQDTSTCKVYIARPCQYIHTPSCHEKYWTSHRFSAEVIQSFNEALDQLKQTYGIASFRLIGYSGGGTVVALLAAQRKDVAHFTTIAGNLDTQYWTSFHHIDPLSASLNPALYASILQHIPQHHMIGSKDVIVPQEVFLSYKNHFTNTESITYSVHDATHTCCWDEIYKRSREQHHR
jgi:dienelactone hydrolase